MRHEWSCQTGIVADTAELVVRDAARWRAWLAKHHESPVGVWLVLAKKGTVEPTGLNHDQALEEALCHGWIDGQLRRRDSGTYFQRFSRRRPRSRWSRRNIELAERLLAEGRMHPAGIVELERARADGRSEAAYAGSASIEVPPDLEAALAAEPNAHEMFVKLAAKTATPSSIGSATPSGPRRESAASHTLSRCSPGARPSTRKNAPNRRQTSEPMPAASIRRWPPSAFSI